MTIQIPIKLLSDDAQMPAYAYEGDAGLDLRSDENVLIRPGGRKLVGTGLAVAIPEGFAGFVQPRSGLAVKEGLSIINSPGLIDSKYRGEIKVALINQGFNSINIAKGDRIAQLVIQQVPKVELVQVAALDETVRGSQGFGSSGMA